MCTCICSEKQKQACQPQMGNQSEIRKRGIFKRCLFNYNNKKLEGRGNFITLFSLHTQFWNGGNLKGLTEQLWDFANLQRSLLCHKDSLEVIYDLIILSLVIGSVFGTVF